MTAAVCHRASSSRPSMMGGWAARTAVSVGRPPVEPACSGGRCAYADGAHSKLKVKRQTRKAKQFFLLPFNFLLAVILSIPAVPEQILELREDRAVGPPIPGVDEHVVVDRVSLPEAIVVAPVEHRAGVHTIGHE